MDKNTSPQTNTGTGLINQIYGDQPMDYAGQFRSAYKNLGQVNAPENIIGEGTRSLANNFVDRYHEKTGQLPTAQQVKDFVGQNLNSRYAEDFITGKVTNDSVKTGLVDPYLQANPSVLPQSPQTAQQTTPAQDQIQQRQLGLSSIVNDLYDKYISSLPAQVDQGFIPQRQRLAANQAATGNYRSGVGAGQDAILAGQEGQTLGGLIGEANKARIGTTLGTATNVEDLLAGERRANEAMTRFGGTLGLDTQKLGLARQQFGEEQRQTDINRGLQQQQLTLSQLLGQQMADANKPGTLEYINTGFRGLNAIANAYSAYRGK